MTDWIKLPHTMNGPSAPYRSNNPERKEGQSMQSWKRECWLDVLNENLPQIDDVNVRNAIFALIQLGAAGGK
jgi:hypothetical protein